MSLTRLFTLLGMLLMGLSLTHVKYYATTVQKRIKAKKRVRQKLHQDLHLLSLEWSALTAPDYLRRLNSQNLDLVPCDADAHVTSLHPQKAGRP